MTTHMRPPGLLTDTYATEEIKVGTRFLDEATGKRYIFAYNAGAATWAAGDVLAAFLTTPAWGHCSTTAGTSLVTTVNSVTLTQVAGIALSAPATTEYGWIQVGGYCSNITTDGNITVASAMVCADNAKVGSVGDETMFHGIFANSTAADASTVGTGWLIGCMFDF